MRQAVSRWLSEERAAVSSEYVILISLIALAIFSGVQLFGQTVAGLYNRPELNQAFGS